MTNLCMLYTTRKSIFTLNVHNHFFCIMINIYSKNLCCLTSRFYLHQIMMM